MLIASAAWRSVLLQRVLQFYDDALALSLDFGLFQLWRRNDDLLLCVLYLDELVEVDGDLLARYVDTSVGRRRAHDVGRRIVVPSSVGAAHAGATGEDER